MFGSIIKHLFAFYKKNFIKKRDGREDIVKWLQKVYELCFPLPSVCPICMTRQERLEVCDDCRAEALRKRSLYGQCQRCHSFGIASDGCANCRSWPQYLVGNVSVWPYQDGWQQAIVDFKFRNMPWLASALAVETAAYLPQGYDLLIPVPLHKNRLRERGYNQSALLAEALAEQRGLSWQNALQRVRDTPHQIGLSREQRLQNLTGAFHLAPKADVQGKHIIVVDDVFTSGATLLHCAQTLYRYGAKSVLGFTLASGQGRF